MKMLSCQGSFLLNGPVTSHPSVARNGGIGSTGLTLNHRLRRYIRSSPLICSLLTFAERRAKAPALERRLLTSNVPIKWRHPERVHLLNSLYFSEKCNMGAYQKVLSSLWDYSGLSCTLWFLTILLLPRRRLEITGKTLNVFSCLFFFTDANIVFSVKIGLELNLCPCLITQK